MSVSQSFETASISYKYKTCVGAGFQGPPCAAGTPAVLGYSLK
jgi:hypothetical protein